MKILCPRRRILPVHSFHRSCPARPALRNLFQVTTVNSRPVFMFLEYPARPSGRADRDAGRSTTVNRNDALTRQRQRRRLRLRITVSDEYQSFLLNRHESRTRPASRGTRCATAALGPKVPETRGPPPSVSRALAFLYSPARPLGRAVRGAGVLPLPAPAICSWIRDRKRLPCPGSFRNPCPDSSPCPPFRPRC